MKNTKEKRTREEIALEEVGRTEISPAQKWFLTLFFVGVTVIIPLVDLAALKFPESSVSLKAGMKAVEKGVEESSVLKDQLTENTQRVLSLYLKTGTENAIIGNQGRLYYRPDIESVYLKMKTSEAVEAILDFRDQLQKRNIDLLLLPVPVKPQTEREMLSGLPGGKSVHNPGYQSFLNELQSRKVKVVDLSESLIKNKVNSRKHQYLATDTHWTPEAMSSCARILSDVLREKGIAGGEKFQLKEKTVSSSGDVAHMLKIDVKEKIKITQVLDWEADKRSPVLLLGDSFSNIYSVPSLGWGESAGFPEHISNFLGLKIDVIRRNDGGASATREILSRALRSGTGRLNGKKIVVWQFAARELVFGNWRKISMIDGEPQKTVPAFGNIKVIASIGEISEGPEKNSPYKDFFRSAVLTDIESEIDLPVEISVRLPAMKNSTFTPSAKLMKGDRVSLSLSMWNQKKHGAVKRSEFDDFDLIEMPVYGIGEVIAESAKRERINLLFLLLTVLGLAFFGAFLKRKSV